ncbi:MAG: acyl carrier protein [Firmicutes bacterium]|nr:acyl carrier protein [Bacillota bacterium]MDY5676788.1 acyl carrier protein [Eubacteriales bacterium]
MTFEKVKKLLADQLNVDANTITEKSKVIDDLGADSLDVVEMLMTLEDEFNVTVSDEESVNLKTVGDIVKLIDSKTKKN